MSLKILKASEPLEVKQIVACLYANPGLGKTSLAFTAEAPLLLDFDKGAHRSAFRGDTVQVSGWHDVAAITAEDLSGYKTLVIDTAGRALDSLAADIIAANPKLGRGGALTLQGYGELKARFIAFTKLVRSFGLDIVLIAHSDEQRQGDDVIERLDMQGASKGEIYKSADLMGRILMRGGKRILTFNPADTAFGKNPAALPEYEIPHLSQDGQFLAKIIADTKTGLNRESAAQQEAAAELAKWQDRIAGLEDADSFTEMVGVINSEASAATKDNAKRVLVKIAKERGFSFDKATSKFAATQQLAA